jgi:transcription factor E2F7/8
VYKLTVPLNCQLQATKFTSPIPEHPSTAQTEDQVQVAEGVTVMEIEPQKRVTHNRKEKSLALLCQNFMELCRDAPPCGDNDETGALVELNELATHLGVKRRRIYDIINIMESVHIVSRLKKNTYRWHGMEKLPMYFARLQKDGLAELRSGVQPDKQIKGMSLTCQKLIQFFLTTGLAEIRLTDAAEAVLGPSNGEDKTFKTKIRRMYDIANVLTSLGIIRKENVAGNAAKAQPSFKWVFHVSPQDMYQHLPPEEQSGEPAVLIPFQPPPVIPPMHDLGQEMEEGGRSEEMDVSPVLPEESQQVLQEESQEVTISV